MLQQSETATHASQPAHPSSSCCPSRCFALCPHCSSSSCLVSFFSVVAFLRPIGAAADGREEKRKGEAAREASAGCSKESKRHTVSCAPIDTLICTAEHACLVCAACAAPAFGSRNAKKICCLRKRTSKKRKKQTSDQSSKSTLQRQSSGAFAPLCPSSLPSAVVSSLCTVLCGIASLQALERGDCRCIIR